MQLVLTGRKHDAIALHRNLKAGGIDAVCMTDADHPTGAVFVPAQDAGNRAAIERALGTFQSTVGGAS